MPSDDQEPIAGVHWGALRDLPAADLLVRFGFGAGISAIAGIVAVLAGSEPAGILLAFPAILPATLTLVEKEEGERKAEDLDVGAILGAAALAAFAVVVWQFITAVPATVVLVSGTLAWLAAAVLLYLGLRVVRVRSGPLNKSIAELRSGAERASRS